METKKQADPDTALLSLFAEFYEKQDVVQRRTAREFIRAYDHSEFHVIDAIGREEGLNLTAIARRLALTRGAVSKIAQRLCCRGDIEKYRSAENRKEIYFRLTERGWAIFDAHAQQHRLWFERDLAFLHTVPEGEKEAVADFIRRFNRYLERKIEACERDDTNQEYKGGE